MYGFVNEEKEGDMHRPVSHVQRLTALLLAVGLVAAACGDDNGDSTSTGNDDGRAAGTNVGDGDDQDGQGGSITIALGSEPTTLDPQARDDGGERAINDNVYETLLSRNKDGELEPKLAAEMPTQVDDTTWEVKLRQGITFHNDEPFNADVVARSFSRIIDPEFKSEQTTFLGGITDVEAVDETTVRFTTDGADPILPSRLYWIKIVPAEYSADADFAEAPAGTGPYEFVEWRRGQQIVLEKNPDYWGDPQPSVDQVTYRFVGEPGTKLSGLVSGEFDLITNLLPEDTDKAPKFAHVQGLEHPVMILNTMDGPTADPLVRQALNLAVDKQALADELFGGYAVLDNCQMLSPSWTGFNEDLSPYTYDPDAAKSLIEDAGATGATIELVGTSGRWLKDRETIEAVAGYWTEAGLNVEIEIFEFNEYLDRLFDRESRPDAIYVTSSNELLDADRTLTGEYHMKGIEASNDDVELAEWIDSARSENDSETREELYAKATQRACDNAYFAFLLNIEDIYGMSERLNWEPRVDSKLLVTEMSVA
jgi:peptide/nickel transport system substrate-binding protein